MLREKYELDSEIQQELAASYPFWEKTKDVVDQLIDIMLNYRQSGHPGGSRSKVHMLLATMLSGAMRWDIRHPDKRFADRFVLGAGHTVPLVYCTLAALNEALRVKHEQTGDARYAISHAQERALYWQELLGFRRRGGLPGHAEMSGKTLFFKSNTGPSGHGAPAAAGQAIALKRAGAEGVRVFIMEGEGGLTPGSTHETLNSAWGLKLDNLYFLVDWNDYGIDNQAISQTVYGTPTDWFSCHGWRVLGTESGSEWEPVTRTVLALVNEPHAVPSAAWFKTRKGRGYLKYDSASHGTPHAINSALFWEIRKEFADKYGARFVNMDGPAPSDPAALRDEFAANLQAAIDVLRNDQDLVDYLADRLVTIGDSVPNEIESLRLGQPSSQKATLGTASAAPNPFEDERLFDYTRYPEDLYVAPGTSIANRRALAKWGAWANAFGIQEYGRPLFLACSADLAGSTNISGFGEDCGTVAGLGYYWATENGQGVLLPQEITEFTNAGIMAGVASTNLADDSNSRFDGFWGACSTYGSFSYLKYGMMRLFSQIAQDCPWKVGKVLWVAGHSGPETADDSRTHFGIFAPGVTQLFPKGAVINLHPWEYNEVPVLLGEALRQEAPIVALHLTRPDIRIPDRAALGMPSHFAAARGAYVVRPYQADRPKSGVVIVQGTSAMAAVVDLLPDLDDLGLNVKIVCATSPQLFALQPEDYRHEVLSPSERLDSTVITTQARWLMHDWLFNPLAEEYALSSDWDDHWRTGGMLEEVLDEAHLTRPYVLAAIERFAQDRQRRLDTMRTQLDALR
jgi:transketolase